MSENDETVERVAKAIEGARYHDRFNMQAQARAAIAAMPDPWRPIDSAPKDGTFVDLWYPENGGSSPSQRIANCRWRDVAWFSQTGGRAWRMDGPFTHWRPLPAAPEA